MDSVLLENAITISGENISREDTNDNNNYSKAVNRITFTKTTSSKT